jgi:arsenate reductase
MRALVAIGLMAVGLAAQGVSAEEGKAPVETIVFVCEHGSAKSLIASQWFNKLAAERGVSVRSVSRGMTPDPAVPEAIARNLAEDGLAPAGFVPKALSKADLATATQIVTIGVDATSLTKGVSVPVETWNDIPPASENYAGSRDAMKARIEQLLTKAAQKSTASKPRR